MYFRGSSAKLIGFIELSKSLPLIDTKNIKDKDNYLNSFDKFKEEFLLDNHKEKYHDIFKQIALTIIDKNWHNHLQILTNLRLSEIGRAHV